MLERIGKIEHIGLLNQANGSKFDLKSNALIYADNGRGKSTLSAMLYSLATGDVDHLRRRQTLDDSGEMSAALLFSHGTWVTYQHQSGWSTARPEVLVFDTTFINRNVHSGGEVTPKHRENFLTFALGAKAVSAQQAVKNSEDQLVDAKTAIAARERQLEAHRDDMPLPQFRRLAKNDNIDTDIFELEARQVSARSAGKILSRITPTLIPQPAFDVDGFFEALNTTLEDVHDQAEEAVRGHLDILSNRAAEVWLQEGQQFDDRAVCPYCGQATDSLPLIQAYRTHFNAAYQQLAARLTTLSAAIDTATNAAAVDRSSLRSISEPNCSNSGRNTARCSSSP